jgi:hypothetical protein
MNLFHGHLSPALTKDALEDLVLVADLGVYEPVFTHSELLIKFDLLRQYFQKPFGLFVGNLQELLRPLLVSLVFLLEVL